MKMINQIQYTAVNKVKNIYTPNMQTCVYQTQKSFRH